MANRSEPVRADWPVVGFDLDMTLIDSRPGIEAVYELLAVEFGVEIDTALVVSRLGPPVEDELANWLPADRVAYAADRYRALYPEVALDLVAALPGAHEAIVAVREAGGRSLIITAKNALNARMHVDRLGLGADQVHGSAWRDGKAKVLIEEGATAYVGDHVHDIEAATLAGVVGVGVATGTSSGLALQEAGAAVVLHSLLDFPDWLASAGPVRNPG